MPLSGLRDGCFEHTDDCMAERLRQLRHHEGADGKMSHGLHDGRLCHRGDDRSVLCRKRHDRHRGSRARTDDHTLLAEGSCEVGAGFQGWHVAETESKTSHADSVDLLEEGLPVALCLFNIAKQTVSVYLDVGERSHRVIDGSTSRSLRKQGGDDSSTHAGPVSQMNDEASHALLLAIDDDLRKYHSNLGDASKWGRRRHGLCCCRRGCMEVEMCAVRRERGRCFDVPSIKTVADLCKHELSA
jgi:hypothetical protein